ncbi:TPM domain-containing protein [Calothrix sp. UHCC 0171]|uniref:TPM domain-containing protein n=1 Tax=Calothrix sp. UHCC 0171 TaxID=3110245 RepID=UPI002B22089F|nr:TPM domain-containing protein [Calothrix sp. UHCC 0171]MEA5572299.1 TPM domain-containing protein [Calothrix sp. UHCC 0171]
MKWNLLKPKRIFWMSLFFSVIFLSPLSSLAVTVQEVPNPRQVNGAWVTDMADILTDETEIQLNRMISRLEAKNGAEIAVVTVPETAPAASPKEFKTKLFNYWGIGKKGKDNGVLFLVSVKDRRVEIETGYGVEGILPDAQVGNIINTEITPRFKQKDFDGGILAGTKALIIVLEPSLKAEINQNTQIPIIKPISATDSIQPTQDHNIFWGLLLGTGVFVFTLGGITVYFNSQVFLPPEGRSRLTDRKYYRVYCSTCKQQMQKVDDSLVESNLSEVEKVAQRIGSIKFEGWKCPKCSQEKIDEGFHLIGWVSKSDEFQECPHCKEWTVKRSQKTLLPPTEYKHGTLLITDICDFCSYFQQQERIIPRLPPPIIISSGGSGGSGGGSSFGGGNSGGGGGGGDW